MINHMLDALKSKSAEIIRFKHGMYAIKFKSKNGNDIVANVNDPKKKVLFVLPSTTLESYIKEADLMAMIYYINEYWVRK